MSFFVTSVGNATGNFGGLLGADGRCQALAAGKGLGGKIWHAYLSTGDEDARTRIGAGPWYNQKGKLIAVNVDALHTNNIAQEDILDENGNAVPLTERSILTGTDADGTFTGYSCNGWLSQTNQSSASCGRVDSSATGNPSDRWNAGASVNGCSPQALANANNGGRIYCFVTN
jgi:hypothetical protein